MLVLQRRAAQELDLAVERGAEALCERDRARVVRTDQADQLANSEVGPAMRDRGLRRFERKAVAPRVARQQPAQLARRPAVRVQESDAPDQAAAGALFDGPHAVAVQDPFAEKERHLSPGDIGADRTADADEAHDLLVGAHVGIGVEVVLAKHAQLEACGGEAVHGRTIAPCRTVSLDADPGATIAAGRVFACRSPPSIERPAPRAVVW
jgi:hypothetical protein